MCLNHLHRNIQEAVQNLPEQDLECQLQKIWLKKWEEAFPLKVKKEQELPLLYGFRLK